MNGSFLSATANKKIGRAMHDWSMFSEGDRVLIGVSGGVDSLVLTKILLHWRDKAPIHFDLLAVHLDMGFDPEGSSRSRVEQQMQNIGIPYLLEATDIGPRAEQADQGKNVCFHCARQRRSRIFAIAREQNCALIALGHHQDDLLETFLLNLLYSGNLSTMKPRQDLFEGAMAIVRPLAYLQKDAIREIAAQCGIEPVKNPCPHDADSRRQQTRDLLAQLSSTIPNAKASMFNALGNVRPEYLLGRKQADHTSPLCDGHP